MLSSGRPNPNMPVSPGKRLLLIYVGIDKKSGAVWAENRAAVLALAQRARWSELLARQTETSRFEKRTSLCGTLRVGCASSREDTYQIGDEDRVAMLMHLCCSTAHSSEGHGLLGRRDVS